MITGRIIDILVTKYRLLSHNVRLTLSGTVTCRVVKKLQTLTVTLNGVI